ncbi:ribonuclease P/MRP protein subunit POP5 [Denticeps clupeoides]|uniref:Ribonuclease P/MRP protein subunit POP5 n=1 Tax=Denticeps clupeoides TaxID=299321 RepID=A0AAY4B2M8_9TELE|nr:ribonuclease P/MRP protein subunit POP5-like [Denticeps clupeoides]
MVRFKSRYLLCEVSVSERGGLQLLEERAVHQAVRSAVARSHGDYGAALLQLGFSVKYVNGPTGVVLLRCRKSHYRLVWSAVTFISSIESRRRKVQCSFNCIHVGGTIRTCQKFLARYSTQQLHRMLPECKTDEERLEVRRAVMSCTLVKKSRDDDDDDEEEDDDVEDEFPSS